MKLGDKMDLNPLTGCKTPEGIQLETRTAQGSVFQFLGRVEGDAIVLTMHVTDVTEGILAKAV